ncbi:MAG: alkaline phosphatase, partial [Alphaproteobacteria bacterium]|nr:alkaline phosphatase [Alphaproteobacteria bacterium]
MRTLLTAAALGGAILGVTTGPAAAQATGDVIFLHPDGTGVNHWGAVRMHQEGPDGELNWDRLPAIGVYTGHMSDR